VGPRPHRSHSEAVRGSSLASNAFEACKVKAQGIAHSVPLRFSHGSGDYLEPVPHGARADGVPNSHPYSRVPGYAPARALAPARLANLASDRPFVLQATLSKLARLSLAGICLADPDPPERGGLRWEAPSTCCGSGDTVANSDNTYLIRANSRIN
jgi:hypothetical protein